MSLRIDVALLGNDSRDARRRTVGDSTISDVTTAAEVDVSSRKTGRLYQHEKWDSIKRNSRKAHTTINSLSQNANEFRAKFH